MIMESSIHERWIIPLKKFGMVRVKVAVDKLSEIIEARLILTSIRNLRDSYRPFYDCMISVLWQNEETIIQEMTGVQYI